MEKGRDWQTLAAKVFCVCIFATGAYIFFKYFFSAVCPFLVGFAIAAAVAKAAGKLSHITGMPKALCAFLLDTLVLCLLGFLIFYACRRLVAEIGKIMELVGSGELASVFKPAENIPLIGTVAKYAEELFEIETQAFLSQTLGAVSDAVGAWLSAAIKAGPSAVLTGVVTVIGVYYMSMDFDKICGLAVSFVPKAYVHKFEGLKNSALYVTTGYIKAYAVLFALTFCETLIGLLILRPGFAWIGALCVAAVDILPVFGAGFVLIPWGVFNLICGDFFVGVGLLILYVIITVVRRIVEPKVIGNSVGLHPLGALMAMFVGSKLFGAWGMILAPVCVSVAVNTLRKNKENQVIKNDKK